jgi:hypothetical protein
MPGRLPARGSCLAALAARAGVLGGAFAGDALGLGEQGFAAGGEEGFLDRVQHGAVLLGAFAAIALLRRCRFQILMSPSM